jgi:anti-anti-sigma factor
MNFQTRTDDGGTVVEVFGRVIDAAESELLLDTITTLFDQGHRNVVVNIEGVPYLDSAFIGVLVRASAVAQRVGAALRLEGGARLEGLFGRVKWPW